MGIPLLWLPLVNMSIYFPYIQDEHMLSCAWMKLMAKMTWAQRKGDREAPALHGKGEPGS